MRKGHVRVRLVGGVADHQSLVSSAHFLLWLVDVDRRGDFFGLLVHGDDHSGTLIVHAHFGSVVAHFLDGLPGHLFEVDLGGGVYLSENHAQRVLDGTLACNFGVRVFLEAGVQN